jgi:hypothetical protein
MYANPANFYANPVGVTPYLGTGYLGGSPYGGPISTLPVTPVPDPSPTKPTLPPWYYGRRRFDLDEPIWGPNWWSGNPRARAAHEWGAAHSRPEGPGGARPMPGGRDVAQPAGMDQRIQQLIRLSGMN